MKILVTGTAGFIGYHLVERLVKERHTIVGLDNINEYYEPVLKYNRLAASGITQNEVSYGKKVQSILYPNYSFYQMHLEDETAINDLFEEERFDVVINLAGQAGVRYSLENPHAYINSNVKGFLNILEACRNAKISHFIYASSSSVYGLNNNSIFSTHDSVDHPVSLYAATKRSNELMAHVYSHLFKLPTTGLRFFTVYGPWGRPDMAPILFTDSIIAGKPIKVFNYGEMERDFTYVSDIAEGIARMINCPPDANQQEFIDNPSPSNSSAPFAIYNIGNSKPVSLIGFIEILENELGIKAKKELLPLQPGDVISTYADVTPLIKKINYQPSTSLQTGIKHFVQWYKTHYNIYV